MKTHCVVFFYSKKLYLQILQEKCFSCDKQVFVYEVPCQYKRIHLHLDRQCFDWKK